MRVIAVVTKDALWAHAGLGCEASVMHAPFMVGNPVHVPVEDCEAAAAEQCWFLGELLHPYESNGLTRLACATTPLPSHRVKRAGLRCATRSHAQCSAGSACSSWHRAYGPVPLVRAVLPWAGGPLPFTRLPGPQHEPRLLCLAGCRCPH